MCTYNSYKKVEEVAANLGKIFGKAGYEGFCNSKNRSFCCKIVA